MYRTGAAEMTAAEWETIGAGGSESGAGGEVRGTSGCEEDMNAGACIDGTNDGGGESSLSAEEDCTNAGARVDGVKIEG